MSRTRVSPHNDLPHTLQRLAASQQHGCGVQDAMEFLGIGNDWAVSLLRETVKRELLFRHRVPGVGWRWMTANQVAAMRETLQPEAAKKAAARREKQNAAYRRKRAAGYIDSRNRVIGVDWPIQRRWVAANDARPVKTSGVRSVFDIAASMRNNSTTEAA